MADPQYLNAKRALAALLLAGLAIRIAMALLLPRTDTWLSRLPDQVGYLQTAQNMLAGRGVVWHDPRFDQDVFAVRCPGYPAFIAACGARVLIVRIAQSAVDVSTALAGALIAWRLVGARAAVIAGALIALNPMLAYMSSLLLSETLFTAMLAWAVLLLISRPSVLAGVALLAISILVRPSGIALPLFMAFAAPFVRKSRGESIRLPLRMPIGAATLLLIAACVFPWALRNHNVLGSWVWLTTQGGITRYDGFQPGATGASDQSFVNSLEFAGLARMTEVERDQFLNARADQRTGEMLHSHPGDLADLTLAKIGRTWTLFPLSAEYGRTSLKWLAGVYSGVFFALTLVGTWQSHLSRSAKVLLLIPAAYFTALHAASVGSMRYRLPAEPPMAVVAASALGASRWRRESATESGASSATSRPTN